MEMLSIVSKIGYVICSLVFLYMIINLVKDALKKKDKWYIISAILMLGVIAIAMSEVF